MRRLLAATVLILATATSLHSADAQRAGASAREGGAAIGERLARIERILWERDAAAVPLLREWAIRDESDRVRERAIGALVTLRDTDVPRVYFDRLAWDGSPRVRRAAADAIGTLAIPVDRPERLQGPLQRDPDPMVRAECARAIGKTGERQAFPFLLLALSQDHSPEVRALSAEALANVGASEATDILKNVAREDRSLLVRAYAVRALAVIDPQSSAETFRAVWEQARDADLRAATYEGLLHTSEAPAWIEAGLRDPDSRVRYRAFHAWQSRLPPVQRGERPPRNSGEVLRLEAFLKDPLRGIREGARQALERLGYRVVGSGESYTIADER